MLPDSKHRTALMVTSVVARVLAFLFLALLTVCAGILFREGDVLLPLGFEAAGLFCLYMCRVARTGNASWYDFWRA